MDIKRTEYKTARLISTGEYVKILWRDWDNMTFEIETKDGRRHTVAARSLDSFVY